jgi:uncharacterized protein (DUF58 family)
MSALRLPIAKARPNATVTVNMLWPMVLVLVLVFCQLVFPSRVWVVLLWLVGGMTGLAYIWAREMARHIYARRVLRYGWMQVGDRLEERFTLENDSWLPLLWGQVIDHSDLPGYRVARIAACDPGGTSRWTTEQVCTRRGLYRLGPWSLQTSDPFGLFTIVFDQPETEAIIIYPPVVALPEITLPQGRVAGPSERRQQAIEATLDASHTRLYRAGDPLRLIHWPSTAHRGTLIVREPDAEISGDLWIVLDLDQRVQAGSDDESTEEYGVVLAASLADRTLRQNRAVGLIAHGEQLAYVPPGRGKGHMWRILQALAEVKAGGTHSLGQVLEHMRHSLGHGTSLLVITPSIEAGWIDALLALTRLGIAPTAVLLDHASFSPDDIPGATTGQRALLAKAGIPSHIIRQGYPFHHIVPLQRRGYWEFKTTPMGRAVVVRRPGEA